MRAYNKAEHEIESERPTPLYNIVLYRACKALALQLKIEVTDAEAKAFAASIADWPAFPDTVSALQKLAKHYHLIVLSNVNNDAFVHTRAKLENGFKFAAVLTAEDIGTYKPDENNFRYMLEKAKQMPGVEKDEDVLVTANSLFHDHVPAQKIGLRSSWISRSATIGQIEGVKYDFRFTTLEDMADALVKEYEAEGNKLE